MFARTAALLRLSACCSFVGAIALSGCSGAVADADAGRPPVRDAGPGSFDGGRPPAPDGSSGAPDAARRDAGGATSADGAVSSADASGGDPDAAEPLSDAASPEMDASSGGTDAGSGSPDAGGELAPGRSHDGRRLRVTEVIGARPLCCTNGILLDGDTLYVDSTATNAVTLVDVNTRQITPQAASTDPPDQIVVTPDDLWLDPDTGDIYHSEILAGGVRRIRPDGTRERITTGLMDGNARPNGIAGLHRPGSAPRIFVGLVEFDANAYSGVWEVDPRGLLPPTLLYGAVGGAAVIGEGMSGPDGMTVDPSGQELFVSEKWSGGRVRAIHLTTGAARVVYDGAPGEVSSGVRFLSDGRLVYNEQSTGRLLILDPDGPPTQTPSELATVRPGMDTVAEHADGRLFVSSFHNGGITILHPDGRMEDMFPMGMDLPEGMALMPDGRLLVADLGSLAIVDPDPSLPPGVDSRVDRLRYFLMDDLDITIGVVRTGPCEVYVSQFFRANLARIDVCDPSQPHEEILARRAFGGAPADMVEHGGDLYVTDVLAGNVVRVSNLDASPSASPIVAGLANPSGIAVGPDELLYVAEQKTGLIRIYSTSGLLRGTISGFARPGGLAFEPDGSLLVVEADEGRLTRRRPDDSREVIVEGLGTQTVGILPLLDYYSDVVFAPGGTIYVSEALSGRLIRLDPI